MMWYYRDDEQSRAAQPGSRFYLGGTRMAYEYKYENSGGGSGGNNELISWLIVVGALVLFWPVGVFLLWRKLSGGQIYSANRRAQHPYDIRRQEGGPERAQTPPPRQDQAAGATGSSGYHYKYEYRYQSQAQTRAQTQSQKSTPGMQGMPRVRRPVDLNKGRAMTVWGAILTAIFGLAAISSIPATLLEGGLLPALAAGAPIMGLLSLGVGLLFAGNQRSKKSKRFRKYLALIGKRESISISSLAQAMPVSFQTAWDDLQDMLDEGYIPTGYLDMGSGRLILSDEGLTEDVPEPEVEVSEEELPDDDSFLLEIKQINDAIADVEMSRKIDRIGEITAKILDYQRKNPSRAGQLRSFLGYYLPTTLKILRAYARLEAQGIEGENIRSAKQRIEGMMDKVVEGFEKQLDKLFQDDAMDITTDVEVLERMLDKDGLSGSGDLFQMGG